MNKPRFLVDAMLKNLARWLRIFGASAVYAQELAAGPASPSDDELLKIALKKKLVLVTADKAFAQKAKNYVPVVFLSGSDSAKQLAEIFYAFNLPISKFPARTTCASCGGKLVRVPKASVEGKVFPKVFSRNRFFWQCKKCKKLFWKGSHWEKILAKAKKVGALVARARARAFVAKSRGNSNA